LLSAPFLQDDEHFVRYETETKRVSASLYGHRIETTYVQNFTIKQRIEVKFRQANSLE